MTALTGTKARDAQDLAKEAAEELEHIKTLKGKEKEKAAKGYLTVRFKSVQVTFFTLLTSYQNSR